MFTDRTGVVYALRHNPTGKIYVGSTRNLDSRLCEHMIALRNNRHTIPDMQQDYNEFGEDYSVCILADYLPSGTERTKIESLYMTILGTRDRSSGYNYLDVTNDFDLSKKKFYSVSSKPDDGVYDPRKRFSKNYKKTGRTKIYYARLSAKMSGSEFANALGVTRQAVSRWETGLSKPSKEMQKKIADYFGVTVDDLLKQDSA